MNFLFAECLSLAKLNLPKYNIYISSMKNIFKGCSDELKKQIKSQNKNLKEEAFSKLL